MDVYRLITLLQLISLSLFGYTQAVAPAFTNLPHTVNNVDANTIVLNVDNIYKVEATDGDGDTPFYFLYSNTDVFSINKVTGEVQAIKNLHYLTSQVITLDIGVWDADDSTNAGVVRNTLTLNVINGNNPPYISNWPGAATATVIESAPANTILCNADVVETDNDALFYDLTVDPSTETGLYYFDKTCTCLKTSGTYSLNYERIRKYLITIQIRDEWSTSAVYTCTVSVTDDNDLPVFTKDIYPVTISEEVSVTVDPSLTCSDEDGETFTYSLMAVNHSIWFDIDPNNGKLTVKSPVDRDTLGADQIYLTVYAVDVRGGTGSTQVLINIDDINDNAPSFSKTTYAFSTTQFTGAGSVIGSIVATDIDKGTNAKFTYSCGTNSDYTGLADGSISTSSDLSSIAYGTTTQLTCYATDLGTPTKTGTTLVDITKSEAPTTTTPTTTTTTEASIWDKTEFVVIFGILMALVGLLVLLGCYFCMRMCMTGYCCGGPAGDCLGYQYADEQQRYQSNRVGHDDYDYEDRHSRSSNSSQGYREPTRVYPMIKDKY